MDRNQHTIVKNISDEETYRTFKNKMFKRLLGYINGHLYEKELVMSENEHKEPNMVGFFILQLAKFRMIELYYNFSDRFCNFTKCEEIEMDTDSLYQA